MISPLVAIIAGLVLGAVMVAHSALLLLWILTAVSRGNYFKAGFFAGLLFLYVFVTVLFALNL
jgi:hypothetical protein